MDRRKFLKSSLYSIALAGIPTFSYSTTNPDVVVIGAGASGLAATARLMQEGKSVICIEAMNRIGGRCYTDNSIFGVPYDLGGHWLHNYPNNQFVKYAKANKKEFKLYSDNASSHVYDGTRKSDEGKKALRRLLKKLRKIEDQISMDVPIIDFIPDEIQNNSWFDTVQKRFKTRDLNVYTPYDHMVNYESGWSSKNGLLKEGYGTLLAHYRKGVPVKLNTIASEIKWDGKGVKVLTNKGTISANKCIVTVSVGVLKAGKIKFTPKLPSRKYAAFENITMNAYLRIALQLNERFYKKYSFKKDSYFYRKVKNEKSISPRTFSGYMKVGGTNVSWFHVKGQFARDLDKEGNQATLDFILNGLKSNFGSDFGEKYVLKSHITDWIHNPFTLGAYSGAMPGKASHRNILKKSVGDRIYFAGEATSGQFQTVHGADTRGERVAEDVAFNQNNWSV